MRILNSASRFIAAAIVCLALGHGVAWAASDPAVARLGDALVAYDKHDFFTTVHLLTAVGQPAKLRDYVTYYLANAELMTNNGDGALKDLAKYEGNPVPKSPLAGRLGLLYSKALLGQSTSKPADAVKARQILQNESTLLPQPDGDYVLGQAFEATGSPREAAICYERVYYLHPAADLAEKAKTAIDRLKGSMNAEFPAASARQQLDRAAAWLTAKQYPKARQEYAALAEQLAGTDRDEAEAGVGAALYLAGDYSGSAAHLAPLKPQGGEGAAERLYYLTEDYRKLNDDAAMMEAVDRLNEQFASSPWRLKALISAGNKYLTAQDRTRYVPLYQAAAAGFPGDSAAALSQWHVAWAAWLDHSPKRVELLKQQVEKFPADTHVSDALFFLGRAAEQESDFAAARAYYERLNSHYPHYYYSGLARERLIDAKLKSAKADATVQKWLAQATDAAHNQAVPADVATSASAATRERIERGRLLIAAGMTTQAVQELEFGARQPDEQPTLLAMELSRAMPTPYLSVKVMKKFSGDYLSLPFDKASRGFWEMLFPMPYVDTLTASATESDLDPYSVAGLIRQESEFNPEARSAVAYGLMQLIPSTGKMLGKRDGIAVPNAGALLNPSLNIKLGTQYLRSQLNQWEGDWVKTLAAYNAGPTRVRDWVRQFGYTDPAEFIENIPFNETRDYVQAVLRNTQVYRELYGKEKVVLAAEVLDDASVPPAKIAAAASVSKVISKGPARVAVRSKLPAKKPAVKNTAVAGAKKTSSKTAASSKKPTATAVSQKHAAA